MFNQTVLKAIIKNRTGFIIGSISNDGLLDLAEACGVHTSRKAERENRFPRTASRQKHGRTSPAWDMRERDFL